MDANMATISTGIGLSAIDALDCGRACSPGDDVSVCDLKFADIPSPRN